MASQQVAGAQAKGVYAFMKHFALNDQETNRLSELATWANEQSIREIYLKPFEMSVKQGGAGAVMSAFNYIGVLLQCLFDRFGSVFPQCGLMVFPGVVIVSR